MNRIAKLASLILVATLSLPAFAADPNPPDAAAAPGAGPDRGWKAHCQANPEQCAERRAKMREKCQANPERCQGFMQHRRGGATPEAAGGADASPDRP